MGDSSESYSIGRSREIPASQASIRDDFAGQSCTRKDKSSVALNSKHLYTNVCMEAHPANVFSMTDIWAQCTDLDQSIAV